MPWLETAPMTQRRDFLADHRRQVFTMTELCARYRVSRKTGYTWLGRGEAAGLPGMADRSRAPHHCPHRLAAPLARLLCQARRAHPSWGPIKLGFGAIRNFAWRRSSGRGRAGRTGGG